MHGRATLLLAALLLSSCVEKQGEKKIDPAYIKRNLLSDVPADLTTRVDADFDGKVVYVGNRVDSTTLAPGGGARIVHYWKVVEPPGAEWRVFSHLEGRSGERMNVDLTDMRTGHPPAKWEAGQVIQDEQRFSLLSDWKSPAATLTVGLYRKGSQSASARMPINSGRADKEGRLVAFEFKVDISAKSGGKEAVVVVRKATGPIVVDGKADEADWKNAPKSPSFTTAEGGRPMGHETYARLLWDDDNLYAFIEASDTDIYSPYTERDDTLWKEDVVELFIDADRNRRGYVELQVNPRNAQFDAWFPQMRGGESHFEWNSSMESKVAITGTLDQRGDRDQQWHVELRIPLIDVKGMNQEMKVSLPPTPGDRWRMNVVRVDNPEKEALTASSWNPITIRDFHALDRMMTIVFATADGQTSVPPATTDSGDGGPSGGDGGTGGAGSSSRDGGHTGARKFRPSKKAIVPSDLQEKVDLARRRIRLGGPFKGPRPPGAKPADPK